MTFPCKCSIVLIVYAAKGGLMKTRLFSGKMVSIGLAVVFAAGVCTGQTYWKRALTYGKSWGTYQASSIIPTPDGKFIVAGGGANAKFGISGICLLKIDACGDTIWTKLYGKIGSLPALGYGCAHAIASTLDGNYLVAGYGLSLGDSIESVCLLKINPNGDTVWTKSYRGTDYQCATALASTGDGSFIVAGYVYSDKTNKDAIYLMKIDSDGDTLWTRKYQGARAYAIIQIKDGNFIVAGASSNLSLLKINPQGDTLWTKTYSMGNGAYESCAATPTPDGNFIITGSDCILKINPGGDTLWTRIYNRMRASYAVTATQDENYVVAGYTMTNTTGLSDVCVLKINPNGDSIWTVTYGGTRDDQAFAFSLAPAANGDFVIGGMLELVDSQPTVGCYMLLLSLIDDRYAKNDSLFQYKIPVSGDSTGHDYTPVKVPGGMTVGPGGTVCWTPKTDSVYKEHVKFFVTDHHVNNDTLTFNVFVNGCTTSARTTSRLVRLSLPDEITIQDISPRGVRFVLPKGVSKVYIYDFHGKLQGIVPVKGMQAVWLPKKAHGRYLAKAACGMGEIVKQFVLVR